MVSSSPEIDRRDESFRKLCEAISTVGSGKLSISQLCNKAGVAQSTWYLATEDPAFRGYFRAWIRDRISVERLLDAVVANMELSGKSGAADRMLAARLADILPGEKLEVSGEMQIKYGIIPDAQILWCYLESGLGLHLWKPCILQAYQQGRLQPEPAPELLGTPEITPEII